MREEVGEGKGQKQREGGRVVGRGAERWRGEGSIEKGGGIRREGG